MDFSHVDLIEVRAWGATVGAVTIDPASGFYAFEYDDAWVDSAQQLSPIMMPNATHVYMFPELARATFHGLPPLLADALPDKFGNALVDAWMAERGVPRDQITSLDRLAYLADRGMGALEFHPPAEAYTQSATALQLADLVAAARAAVRGDIATSPSAHDALNQLIQVGTSAGGARAKAVIAYNPSTDQIRSGQLDAPVGFEHWLIKLDGVGGDDTREADPFTAGAGYGCIEYAYYLMAQAAGVEMTECRLLREGTRAHFLTRRFDRDADGGRHHVLSLCAMAHLDFNLARTHSYSQYLQTIDALELGADAREQAFRRIVFNVAAVNRDDHTKNLSFVAPEGGAWNLAPAYDLIHSHNPEGEWTRRHQMSVVGKFDDIGVDDLKIFADRHLVPGYRDVIAEVLRAVDQWHTFADEAEIPPDQVDRIASDLEQHRPL